MYVNFKSKNWSYKGDKGSWASIDVVNDQKVVTVKRAHKGTISSAYEQELSEFCTQHGIDWRKVGCGDTVSVVVE